MGLIYSIIYIAIPLHVLQNRGFSVLHNMCWQFDKSSLFLTAPHWSPSCHRSHLCPCSLSVVAVVIWACGGEATSCPLSDSQTSLSPQEGWSKYLNIRTLEQCLSQSQELQLFCPGTPREYSAVASICMQWTMKDDEVRESTLLRLV